MGNAESKIHYGVKTSMFHRFNEVKVWIICHEKELFISFLVVLSSTLSYGLGRLSKIDSLRTPVTITNPASAEESNIKIIETEGPSADTRIVASKKGSKYYFPWCGGSKAIKLENRTYFLTPASAEAAGYTRAANCQPKP